MALTIRNISDDQIEMAKAITGLATGSGSVVACVELAVSQSKMIAELESQVSRLQAKCNRSDRILESLSGSADEILTMIRQGELFDSPPLPSKASLLSS